VRILADFGAYAYFPANYMARVVGMLIPGAYRLRHYRYAITTVLTNKCPSGPYRAPMLVCSWVTEGTIDAVARALAMDPVDVRRPQHARDSDLPYTTATGFDYRSVHPGRRWSRPSRRSTTRSGGASRPTRAGREGHRIGVATYVEPNTYGSEFYKSAGIPGSGHDAAIVRIEPSGSSRRRSASSARGKAI